MPGRRRRRALASRGARSCAALHDHGALRRRIKQSDLRRGGEAVDLVAPCEPAGPSLPREQLDIGPVAKPLDAPIDFIGLARVLATPRDDELAHVFGVASRLT